MTKEAIVGFLVDKDWLHGPSKGGHDNQHEPIKNHNSYASRSDLLISGGCKHPKVDYLLESCEKIMGLHAAVIPLPKVTGWLTPD